MKHKLAIRIDEDWFVYLSLECPYTTIERPCALIHCEDHEETTKECLDHGGIAQNKCWAVDWIEACGTDGVRLGDLKLLNKLKLSIDVGIEYDDGVVLI